MKGDARSPGDLHPASIPDSLGRPGAAQEPIDWYRQFLEVMPVAVLLVETATGRLSYMNRRAIELCGTNYVGLDLDECLSQVPPLGPDTAPHLVDQVSVSRALRSGEQLHSQAMMIERADGVLPPVWVNSAPLPDAAGRAAATIVVLDDASARTPVEEVLRWSAEMQRKSAEVQRKSAEMQRKSAEAQRQVAERAHSSELLAQTRLAEIEDLYRNALVGLCALDRGMRYMRINQRLAEVHGLTVEEHLGKTVREVLPTLADQVEPLFRRLMETGESRSDVEIEVLLPSQPGVVRHLLEQWLPVVDASGRIVAVSVVAEEITQRREAEQEARYSTAALHDLNETLEQRVNERTAQLRALAARLVQAEEEERRRLAQMMHDGLQQTLAAAMMQLHIAQRQVGYEDQSCVQEALRLLGEVMESSRSLTAELSPAVLHDDGLIPALEWLAHRVQQRYGLVVDLDIAGDEILRHVPQDLAVVFYYCTSELLFNVHKHAGVQEARLALAFAAPDCVKLTVADEGRGFEVTRTSTDSAPGGGYGLLSVQERILYAGGQYLVESTPGRGTKVTLSLLLAPGSATPSVKDTAPVAVLHASTPPPTLPKLRLVLIDDHSIVRQGLTQLLNSQPDFEVVGEGEDGWDAITAVRQTQPNVVLMDVAMPHMDGIEATQRLVAEFPGISVIGLSMFGDEDKEQAMRQAGAVAFMAKGAPPASLVAVIRACGSQG